MCLSTRFSLLNVLYCSAFILRVNVFLHLRLQAARNVLAAWVPYCSAHIGPYRQLLGMSMVNPGLYREMHDSLTTLQIDVLRMRDVLSVPRTCQSRKMLAISAPVWSRSYSCSASQFQFVSSYSSISLFSSLFSYTPSHVNPPAFSLPLFPFLLPHSSYS